MQHAMHQHMRRRHGWRSPCQDLSHLMRATRRAHDLTTRGGDGGQKVLKNQ